MTSVARIQEEIKECRGGRTAGYLIIGLGLLFAISPFLICLVVLIIALVADKGMPGSPPGLQYLVWTLPIGIAAFIIGIIVAAYYDHKIKKLIRELDQKQ